MVVQNNTVVVKVLKTFPFKNESLKISCNVIFVCRRRPFFGSKAYHDFLISARQSRFMYKNNMSISLDFSTAKNRTEIKFAPTLGTSKKISPSLNSLN